MHDFLVSTIAFIILIGIMVVVHELGHFLVAKFFGVRVEAFSVGMGPRLFGIKRGDTDYKVCLLPIGGFVKMTGENPGEDQAMNDPGSFTAHPRWQRMLIGVAGPVANFILAFVLMAFYFGWINEVPAHDVKTTSMEWVIPGSDAAEAGLQPGDTIRKFDSDENPTWEHVYARMSLDPNQTVPVTVDRDGRTVQTELRIPGSLDGDDLAGMLPQYMPGPITIQTIMPGMPAAQAGLRAGDSILSVDGQPFHSVTSLLAYMQAGKGKPISLVIRRNGAAIGPIVARPAKLDTAWKLGFMAVPVPIRPSPLPLKTALAKSTQFCASGSTLIVQMLERIATHQVSAKQLTGPVGIAQIAGEAAETKGWYSKFYLAGEISLNLGILNLMPFPILDGGLILLLLIESVLRHDISIMVKERIYQAAFVVLMMFFAFVIFNDVTKLPIFNHLKP
ncbi:MAG TPA: RIP metalloprotease RseP [Terracidiphilus sp.]|jgi:regulator of sigma E protease|nr:RIP metalloprotease RseP [Terracidiphilus sp.]